MRVGVLCGTSPRSLYVANTLCEHVDVRCVVSEVGRKYSWKKLRRALRPATLRTKLYRRIQPLLFPPDEDQVRFFFPDGRPRFSRSDLVRPVPHIDAREVVEILRRHSVELIAVFGTSLIRNPDLLALAPGRILNLHGGLSPWYRGADSTFWALYNNEIEKVGCTIHFVNRAIDAGAVIARGCPAVAAGDCEYRLLFKAIKLGASLYVEAIRRLGRGEALGTPQEQTGRLYLFRDRQYRHDRKLRCRYASGCYAHVRLPQRITWFIPGGPPADMQPEPIDAAETSGDDSAEHTAGAAASSSVAGEVSANPQSILR